MPTIKAQAVMANSIAVTLMYHDVSAKSEEHGVPSQFIPIPKASSRTSAYFRRRRDLAWIIWRPCRRTPDPSSRW